RGASHDHDRDVHHRDTRERKIGRAPCEGHDVAYCGQITGSQLASVQLVPQTTVSQSSLVPHTTVSPSSLVPQTTVSPSSLVAVTDRAFHGVSQSAPPQTGPQTTLT